MAEGLAGDKMGGSEDTARRLARQTSLVGGAYRKGSRLRPESTRVRTLVWTIRDFSGGTKVNSTLPHEGLWVPWIRLWGGRGRPHCTPALEAADGQSPSPGLGTEQLSRR